MGDGVRLEGCNHTGDRVGETAGTGLHASITWVAGWVDKMGGGGGSQVEAGGGGSWVLGRVARQTTVWVQR